VVDLPQNVAPLLTTEAGDPPPVTDDAASATSSEESFERVSTSDLAEYDATATVAKIPPIDSLPDAADDECATVDPASDDVNTSCLGETLCQ